MKNQLRESEKNKRKREKSSGRVGIKNGGDGPHPAESLPPAAAARHGLRASLLDGDGEASRSSAGRSCLPQIKFPPSLTAPIGRRGEAAKETAAGWRGDDLRREGTEEAKAVARDNTRDSMVFWFGRI